MINASATSDHPETEAQAARMVADALEHTTRVFEAAKTLLREAGVANPNEVIEAIMAADAENAGKKVFLP